MHSSHICIYNLVFAGSLFFLKLKIPMRGGLSFGGDGGDTSRGARSKDVDEYIYFDRGVTIVGKCDVGSYLFILRDTVIAFGLDVDSSVHCLEFTLPLDHFTFIHNWIVGGGIEIAKMAHTTNEFKLYFSRRGCWKAKGKTHHV